jgi:large subunit ribosomal protein L25
MEASVRKNMSRSYLKDLFKRGLVPAVMYGKTLGSLPLEVNEKKLQDAVKSGQNSIIDLLVSGNGGSYKVMVRDLQYDPIKGTIRHADFQQISLKERIHTTIPVNLSGKVVEGLARLALRYLEISCLPAKIPGQITVDVSGMKPGDTVVVSDLEVPKGIDVLTDRETAVVTVLAPAEEPRGEAAVEDSGREGETDTEKQAGNDL